jgi:hypothetical protein
MIARDPRAIPDELWERMDAFLARGATGSLTLHVHAGAARVLEVRERVERERAGRSADASTRDGGDVTA